MAELGREGRMLGGILVVPGIGRCRDVLSR